MLYAVIIGVLGGLYTVWSLARRQYLSVDKLFNTLSLAICAGYAASLITQSVINQVWQRPLTLSDLWINPRSLVVLVAVIAMFLVSSKYITSIRYPYWKVMDMLALGLTVVIWCLLAGWLVIQPHWGSIIAVASMLFIIGGLFYLYVRVDRPGLTFAVHITTLFMLTAGIRHIITSWQLSMSGVEWIAEGLGVALGLLLVGLRVSARSEKVILQDIPRGVSQSFRDTFTRTFKYRQLSDKTDSSSHK